MKQACKDDYDEAIDAERYERRQRIGKLVIFVWWLVCVGIYLRWCR